MHSSHNEFEFLTQETVRLSESFTHEHEMFLKDDFQRHTEVQPIADQKKIFPNNPGVVYRIISSGNTFSIKGFASHNISESMEELEDGNQSYLRSLKIENNCLDGVSYFELENFDRAEILIDQVFNKRFPTEEDVLCNISDPGFSWWYGRSEDGFRVNFRSHKFMCKGERIKLGPIGDVVIACFRFEKLKEYFKYHLPISEIVLSEKQFTLKSSDFNHPILKELMQLFEKGILMSDSILLCELDETLKYYLLELADIRKFWIEIEAKIETGKNRILN